MFEIGWSELLVIGVVALIAIGPKELPGVLRMVGQWMGKIRRMAGEFQGQFQEAMREAELADIKKSVDEMTTAAQDITRYDPLENVRHDIEGVTGDISTLDAKPAEPTPPAEPATAATAPASIPAAEPIAPPPEPATATSSETPPAKPIAERP